MGRNARPEPEGIKTRPANRNSSPLSSRNARPEPEGIKTFELVGKIPEQGRNARPEPEGIKTLGLVAVGKLLRVETRDLNQKGLRPSKPVNRSAAAG